MKRPVIAESPLHPPPFTLNDVFRGIRKRKVSIVLCLIGIPALVLIATLLAPKKYKSSAKLFVRLGRENASLDATTTLGENPVVAMPLSRESEINSIAEMINNRSLFAEVVDEVGVDTLLKKQSSESGEDEEASSSVSFDPIDFGMGLLKSAGVVNDLEPREKAIIRLQKKLTIEPVAKSNIVLVEYESHDPKVSHQVVSIVTEKYLERHAAIHRNQGAYEFLETQTADLKKRLNQNEDRLEALKNDSSVADLDSERKLLVERRARITDAKLEAEAQLVSLESEVERLTKLMSAQSETMVIEETVGAGNEGADGMRQELYRLEVERERLLSRFTETHPKVKAVNDQITNAKKIVAEAEKNRKESKRGPNEVFQKLAIEVNVKRPMLDAIKTKANEYSEQLAAVNAEIASFLKKETEYKRLDRQLALDDATYRKYVNNLQQAKIDASLKKQKLSNISVAQPASLEPKPSKPNKLINLLLGIAFGVFVGFGQAIFREYKSVVSSPTHELEREVNLPVLGSLSTIAGEPRLQPAEVTQNES